MTVLGFVLLALAALPVVLALVNLRILRATPRHAPQAGHPRLDPDPGPQRSAQYRPRTRCRARQHGRAGRNPGDGRRLDRCDGRDRPRSCGARPAGAAPHRAAPGGGLDRQGPCLPPSRAGRARHASPVRRCRCASRASCGGACLQAMRRRPMPVSSAPSRARSCARSANGSPCRRSTCCCSAICPWPSCASPAIPGFGAACGQLMLVGARGLSCERRSCRDPLAYP